MTFLDLPEIRAMDYLQIPPKQTDRTEIKKGQHSIFWAEGVFFQSSCISSKISEI